MSQVQENLSLEMLDINDFDIKFDDMSTNIEDIEPTLKSELLDQQNMPFVDTNSISTGNNKNNNYSLEEINEEFLEFFSTHVDLVTSYYASDSESTSPISYVGSYQTEFSPYQQFDQIVDRKDYVQLTPQSDVSEVFFDFADNKNNQAHSFHNAKYEHSPMTPESSIGSPFSFTSSPSLSSSSPSPSSPSSPSFPYSPSSPFSQRMGKLKKKNMSPIRIPQKMKDCAHVWQFCRDLLQNQRNDLIIWLDSPKGIFKILKPNDVAELWGNFKHQKKKKSIGLERSVAMCYPHMSKGMRYSRKCGYFGKIDKEDINHHGKKLVFKFSSKSVQHCSYLQSLVRA